MSARTTRSPRARVLLRVLIGVVALGLCAAAATSLLGILHANAGAALVDALQPTHAAN